MTRSLFGKAAWDMAVTIHPMDNTLRAADQQGTAWDAPTGGTQLLDLEDLTGNAISSFRSRRGQYAFYGPDGVKWAWVDFGGGERELVVALPDIVDGVLEQVEATQQAATEVEQARQEVLAVPTTTDGLIAGRMNDPASATVAALAGPPVVYYVDPAAPANGSGKTWRTAFRTIQAAVDAIPAGRKAAMIVLAPVGHDIVDGVTWPRDRLGTIVGATPLRARQHADSSFNQAYLYSSSGTKPSSFIKIPAGTGNVYGFNAKHIYINGDDLAIGGAAFELHAVNRAVFEDIGGRTLSKIGDVMLVKSDAAGGDDGSWLTFRDCSTNGLAAFDGANSNYLSMDSSNSFMGLTAPTGRPTRPAVKVYGSQPQIDAHLEGWVTGIHVLNTRGALCRPASEWVNTLVYLQNCTDSIVIANSSAGAGASEVLDETGTNNTVIGALHRKTSGTKQALSVSSYGTSPTQLSAGSASPIYGAHPTKPNPGIELMPDALDLVGCGSITADYWDGAAWQTWTGINPNVLALANDQVVIMDATHSRVRFRSTGLFNNGQGLALLRYQQPNGANTTVTFRLLKGDNSVWLEYACTLEEAAQKRGAMASFPEGALGNTLEVEINAGITGGQVGYVRRMALYAADVHPNVRGRMLRGSQPPEGVATGYIGDHYRCTDYRAQFAGYYIKTTDGGTSGWRRAALLPANLPSLGTAATDAATTQTLANNIRSALVAAGWAVS